MRIAFWIVVVLGLTYSQLHGNTEYAVKLIIQHEGFVAKHYKDADGISIGYGTNITKGIS